MTLSGTPGAKGESESRNNVLTLGTGQGNRGSKRRVGKKMAEEVEELSDLMCSLVTND